MSVVQTFSVIEDRDSIIDLANAHPHCPRIIGIDVGQRNLALWMGMPYTDGPLAKKLSDVRFRWLGWVIVHCSPTKTTREACAIVVRALDTYKRSLFALASDIVIEKQHKKNGRMRAIAAAIRKWVRKEVPHAGRMRIVDRHARSKFATIFGMPCPMPRDYQKRKQASMNVVNEQTRRWAGDRWCKFLWDHLASGDDLSDAALIAQDYAIAKYLLLLVSTDALARVMDELNARRQRNTWHKTKQRRPLMDTECSDDSEDDGPLVARAPRKRVRAEFTGADEYVDAAILFADLCEE